MPIEQFMPIRRTRVLIASAIVGISSLMVHQNATAQELSVELNKMEANDAGCLAYLLLNNQTPQALDSLVFDFYTFNAEGIIGENLPVQLAPVAASKMTVKGVQFSGECATIAQVLLNSVSACTSGGTAVEGCAENLALSSKSTVELTQ